MKAFFRWWQWLLEHLRRASFAWVFLFASLVLVSALADGLRPQLNRLSIELLRVAAATVCIILITVLFLRHLDQPLGGISLTLIGLWWLGLSLLVEVGAARFVLGQSWESVWGKYHLLRGRLWGLVLAMEVLSPLLIGTGMLSVKGK